MATSDPYGAARRQTVEANLLSKFYALRVYCCLRSFRRYIIRKKVDVIHIFHLFPTKRFLQRESITFLLSIFQLVCMHPRKTSRTDYIHIIYI